MPTPLPALPLPWPPGTCSGLTPSRLHKDSTPAIKTSFSSWVGVSYQEANMLYYPHLKRPGRHIPSGYHCSLLPSLKAWSGVLSTFIPDILSLTHSNQVSLKWLCAISNDLQVAESFMFSALNLLAGFHPLPLSRNTSFFTSLTLHASGCPSLPPANPFQVNR